jgi:hypothetical protein
VFGAAVFSVRLGYDVGGFLTVGGGAALAGSVAAGIAGSLSNDSGPLLLVISTFAVVTATVYVRGDPRLAQVDRLE